MFVAKNKNLFFKIHTYQKSLNYFIDLRLFFYNKKIISYRKIATIAINMYAYSTINSYVAFE